jgi:HEAT repeat protein
VADLLGTLGDRRAVEALRILLSDDDEDVASAAQDALALLEEV